MNETTQNTIKMACQQLSGAKGRFADACRIASSQMKELNLNLNKLKKMKKTVLLLSMFAVCLSCKKESDFTKVKVGMTVAEVVAIVGEPKAQQDNPMLGKWYVYEKNVVVFNKDTVVKSSTAKELEKSFSTIMTDLDSLDSTIEKNLKN